LVRLVLQQNFKLKAQATTSPSTKLHVFEAGTAMITVDSGATSPYKAGIEFLRSSINGGSIYNDGGAVQIKFDSYFAYDSANPSRGGFQFRTAPVSNNTMVDAVRIDALGNVGIGTTSPAYKLDVNGQAQFVNGIVTNTGTPVKMIVSGGILNDSTEFRTGNGEFKIYSGRFNAAHQSFVFATGDNYTSGAERMRITSGGVMAIGTSTPNGTVGKLEMGLDGAADGIGLYNGTGTSLRIWRESDIGNIGRGATPSISINASGNVGIGTTSPSQKLHVAGDIRIGASDPSGLIEFGGTNNRIYTSGGDLYLHQNWASSNRVYLASAGAVTVIGDTNNNDSATSHIFTIQEGNIAGGNSRMVVTKAGNVGIGTTSPTSRLQVQGSGTTNATTAFRVENANASGSMVVLDDGNVGIGTTSPSEILHVNSSTDPTILISNGGGTSPSPRLTLYRQAGVSAGIIYDVANKNLIFQNDYTTADSAGNIYFNTRGSNNRLTITGAGNVGIGTTTPTSKLHVSGSARIDEVLTLTPLDPLPTGSPTGSFAVSASVPPIPYFYDGTSWNALY
jgi:hypothetical protein